MHFISTAWLNHPMFYLAIPTDMQKAIQNILDMDCYFSKVPQLMASFMSSSRANNPLR